MTGAEEIIPLIICVSLSIIDYIYPGSLADNEVFGGVDLLAPCHIYQFVSY